MSIEFRKGDGGHSSDALSDAAPRDTSDVDRPPLPQSRPTFQPARRRLLLVRWLVVMLIVLAAAFAALTLISIQPDHPDGCPGRPHFCEASALYSY